MSKTVLTTYVGYVPAGGVHEVRFPYAFTPTLLYDVNASGYWIVNETKGDPVSVRVPPERGPVYTVWIPRT